MEKHLFGDKLTDWWVWHAKPSAYQCAMNLLKHWLQSWFIKRSYIIAVSHDSVHLIRLFSTNQYDVSDFVGCSVMVRSFFGRRGKQMTLEMSQTTILTSLVFIRLARELYG